MMGNRQPLKSADEHDVTSGWRKVLCWCERSGAVKAVKRRMSRRARRQHREWLRREING